MTIENVTSNYTLDETEALKIINSPIKKVKKTNIEQDFDIPRVTRIKKARKFLDSRK